MSASVDEPKELCCPSVKLDVVAEAGDQGDSGETGDHIKETKKGLFGRSAEFLKSPEPAAVESPVVNERNGNVAEGAPKKIVPVGNEENSVTDTASDKVKETEEAEKEPLVKEETNACERKEVEEEKTEGTLSVEEKPSANVEKADSEEVTNGSESKVASKCEVEKSEEPENTEKSVEGTVEGSAESTAGDVKEVEAGTQKQETDDVNNDVPDAAGDEGKEESGNPEIKEAAESSGKKARKAKPKATKVEEPMNERRRSLRTPKPAPVSTPPKAATEKVVRKPAAKTEKGGGETPTKAGTKRKDEKSSEAPSSKKAVTTPKQSSSKKRRLSDSEKKGKGAAKDQASDVNDPFNISNIDNHPVILGNIQIHTAQFGSLKFTKASPGTSHGRYEKTEQTAGERQSNLADMAPRTTPRKSLSELSGTVGNERRESGSKSKRRSNAKMAKETAAEGEPMETDEAATPKSVKKSRGTAKTPQTAKKAETQSRKRPSSTSGTPVSTKQQKMEPETPKLSPDEQYVVDHRENEHMPYKLGARVYALWNREYYSAVITSDFDAAGRYGVTFVQDSLFRKLVITGIIPLQAIVPGVKVYTTDPDVPEKDARLEEVEVLSAPDVDRQKWFEGIFTVKVCETGKEFGIPWDKLCFGVDEAKTLQTAKFNNVTDVIADNIDSKEGRRTRASRHSFAPEVVASPNIAKQTPKKRATANRDKRAEVPATVEIGLTEKQTKQSKAGSNASEIFAGVSFVVTSAMRRLKEEEQGGFSKREIRQMIEGCGGIVVEDFTKISSGVQMYLIADTHYRTHKYLSALARSVPCVSHKWIRECVEKSELVDYKPYMLPAGVSLLTNKLTPWHQSNNTLLSGKRIYVYTRNTISDASAPNFIEIWSPLVAEMGAAVLNEIPEDGIDILLTDATCPDDLVQQARKCNALVVSSEWIIQAIIEGSLPDPNAHERFRYDFIERPEGA